MHRSYSTKHGLPLISVGLLGILLGAIGVYVWIQEIRFRAMETEEWTDDGTTAAYMGSVSCRECHERFYKLWSPSHHGKAMQPVTRELADKELLPLTNAIAIGTSTFGVDLAALTMTETSDAASRDYPMVHALGGKNVFFFLTPLKRGRLQVLPLSFDVRRREWFNTTDAMVRHFDDAQDAPVDWRDPLLTFNTACYNCHVSQVDKNYDPVTDSYRTTWAEPGITCEACHGPGEAHSRICKSVPKGTSPKSVRLIRWRDFTKEQSNDACAACHTKGRMIADGFGPGDRLFDYYDLVCLEDRDFYPDGRDLGENYTTTGWMMNPCAQTGELNCLHCHTSSGRYRFKDKNPNGACMPCHPRHVNHPEAHTHHPATNAAPRCIDCHMPKTEFSRMLRSDHSFRPPTPEAGARFGSPVACLLCHDDKTAEWAAVQVHQWCPAARWQQRVLREGELIADARKNQWDKLPAMLVTLEDPGTDPVMVTSLIRLLATCPDAQKWKSIQKLSAHKSPIVRAAVVTAVRDNLESLRSRAIAVGALSDDFRLVRVQAAWALSRLPREQLAAEQRDRLASAETELLMSFNVQPDRWHGHYNLGNYRSERGEQEAALEAYQRASELRPDVVVPYVNASVVASQLGRLPEAVAYLRTAHRQDPANAAVNLNLGLALAEQQDFTGAAKHLRLALAAPESRARAAYNLAVLLAPTDPEETIRLCAMAAEAAPDDPRHAYAHAFYLNANGRADEAITVLRAVTDQHPAYVDAWMMLGEFLRKADRINEVREHYQAMVDCPALPRDVRAEAGRRLRALPAPDRGPAGPPEDAGSR